MTATTPSTVRPIEWIRESAASPSPGRVRLIDQTALPLTHTLIETDDLEQLWHAIRSLQVRGAPAIGICAAMAIAAHAQKATTRETTLQAVDAAATHLATSRPTAVNLFWAIARMQKAARAHSHLACRELQDRLAEEAIAIRDEDARMCKAIGLHGASLLKDGDGVLTHCNAGALATSELGTALAPIYTATAQGMAIHVYADETRPLLQGARLTAWELQQAGIPVTLICDSVAAQVMREGRIACVMVGADRIAANGDTANKIGTYSVAVLAHAHHIPFYVLAPTTTFDPDTPDGSTIPIELRDPAEVTLGFGTRTAPEGIDVYTPAFDVTPASLISAIICEKGILRGDLAAGICGALA